MEQLRGLRRSAQRIGGDDQRIAEALYLEAFDFFHSPVEKAMLSLPMNLEDSNTQLPALRSACTCVCMYVWASNNNDNNNNNGLQ